MGMGIIPAGFILLPVLEGAHWQMVCYFRLVCNCHALVWAELRVFSEPATKLSKQAGRAGQGCGTHGPDRGRQKRHGSIDQADGGPKAD